MCTVLDSRPRGCRFEPHRHHCIASLNKTHYSLLSTGSSQEDRPKITGKFVDWDVNNQMKHTNNGSMCTVLDSRPRGCRFEPHRHHCIASLNKTHYSLLSTGSSQEDRPKITGKFVDWDVNNQMKHTNKSMYKRLTQILSCKIVLVLMLYTPVNKFMSCWVVPLC